MEASYGSGLEEQSGPVLTKGDLVILCAVMAEQKAGNQVIWEYIQTDLERTLDQEKAGAAQMDPISGDLASFAHIVDCIYRVTRNISEDLINKIGMDCL